MKKRIAVSDLMSNNESYYSLVIGIAKRARDIAQHAEDEHEILSEKPVQLALEEYSAGGYRIVEPK